MKRSLFLSTLLSVCFFNVFSQHWALQMQDPNANFYDIKQDFEAYWEVHDPAEKGKGYKAFMRWANFVGPRVYPSGQLSLLSQSGKNFEEWQQKYMTQIATSKPKGGSAQIASVTFTPMGPFGALSGQAGNQNLKSGRLNFITIDPTNINNLWVGAPAGGLWRSTNGGSTWTTNTDNLSVNGCSDLAIDPTNTNVMYLATGDGDAGDTRTIGVLKSTDGGLTWSATGLTNNVTSYFLIRRLLINPNNTQMVFAATNQGIYRTINGGTSWTVVNPSNTYDLEFKPGNPNVVYASGSSFRVSTNGGTSFTTVSSGIPTSSGRMAIAVTPADTNYVYVLAGNSSNGGFLGFYKSTNGAASFTTAYTGTLNLLGWSSGGGDSGGQAWYDLAVAASPLNKDEVVTGGVNVWRTTDGGTSFSIYGHWTGNNAPFTHADHHDLEYSSGGVLFNCNDGTVYKRTSTSWTEISGSMNISQIYRLGLSGLTPNKWITGHQDNGTSIYNSTTSTYSACLGGDGMDCFFDRTNDNVVFGESQYGNLKKSTNGGQTWSSCTNGLPSSNGPWLTVWKQDPQHPDTLYCGYEAMYRSTNLGGTWTALSPMPNNSSDVIEFAIAPSNNQVIYVLKGTGIYKTTNAGSTWTTVTNGVPVSANNPQYICIDPTDPDNAWVVLSGYNASNKVYMTTNGGASWSNYTSNLPNLPANCCVYQPGSSDRIYVGMDVGIYYRDNNSSVWTLYNAGLPNTPVSELEISPANPNKLYAATYGRGVWMADLASLAPAAPITNFTVTPFTKCTNAVVTFSDQSSNLPTSWSWSVYPSAGYSISSTSDQNPQVTFTATGFYTVSLHADNTIGPGNVVTHTFAVLQSPTVSVAASVQTVCSSYPVTFTASGANTYTWAPNGGGGTVVTVYPINNTAYTLTGFTNGCPDTYVVPLTVLPGPSLSVTGTQSTCAGSTVQVTASGASTYTWSTGSQQAQIIETPTASIVYTVNSRGSNNCITKKTHPVSVYALPIFTISSSDTSICNGESVKLYGAGANSFTWEPGSVVGYTLEALLPQTTTYTLTGYDQRKCENTVYHTIIVDECLDVREVSGILQVEIYPNPGTGEFYLKSPVHEPLVVSVKDVAGKLLYEGTVNNATGEPVSIDLRAFSQGLYFLEVNSRGRKPATIRVIKRD